MTTATMTANQGKQYREEPTDAALDALLWCSGCFINQDLSVSNNGKCCQCSGELFGHDDTDGTAANYSMDKLSFSPTVDGITPYVVM